MNLEQSSKESDESTLFGELYEWKNCSIPRFQITSLLIADDLNFSSLDLTVICEISPLRQLFLHNLPNLNYLPPEIARLKWLKVLSITHCRSLSELSLAVRFLFNLETLRIDCPNIRELPAFLCLMPSLNIILLRKSVAICYHCKQHPRKSSRIIILPRSETEASGITKQVSRKVLPLSVLSANSYISYFSSTFFYQSIPFRMLWPSLEAALSMEINRCIICLSKCTINESISISFTRFLNCKCIHLNGFLCSKSCHSTLYHCLCVSYPNAEILTATVPTVCQPQLNIVNPLTFVVTCRRIKKMLSKWTGCIPRYHKKSYTVNAR